MSQRTRFIEANFNARVRSYERLELAHFVFTEELSWVRRHASSMP